MFQIDKALRRITPGYCKNYDNLIMLMRGKPKEVKIDVGQLMKDLDNMDGCAALWYFLLLPMRKQAKGRVSWKTPKDKRVCVFS